MKTMIEKSSVRGKFQQFSSIIFGRVNMTGYDIKATQSWFLFAVPPIQSSLLCWGRQICRSDRYKTYAIYTSEGWTSRLSQWWIHFYLEILVPPVGSGDYSQLGFSILRSNNFVTKEVINVQFSKQTWCYNVVFEYFCSKPEISLQRLKNGCKVMQQEFYIGNF